MEKVLATLLPGASKGVRQSRREILSACRRTCPVIITGEKGTGKDHAAGIIHTLTTGEAKPFRRIDLPGRRECPDLSAFGNGGGTHYLDHLEGCYLASKIMREDYWDSLPPNNRLIISYTTGPKEEGKRPFSHFLVAEKISVVHLPPLRRRKEDIPLLAGNLCRRHAHDTPIHLSAEDLEHLCAHHWPGNLHELWEWLEQKVIRSPDREDEHGASPRKPSLSRFLDREIDTWVETMIGHPPRAAGILKKVTGQVEKSVIKSVLDRTGGNQLESARLLGINRNTLARMIASHGLLASARRRRKPAERLEG